MLVAAVAATRAVTNSTKPVRHLVSPSSSLLGRPLRPSDHEEVAEPLPALSSTATAALAVVAAVFSFWVVVLLLLVVVLAVIILVLVVLVVKLVP